MPPRDMMPEEIEAEVLHRLFRRGSWGSNYTPVSSLKGWLGSQIKRDGKEVEKAIKRLQNKWLVFLHKGGETVSLNPHRSSEIMEFIDEYFG